VTDRILLTDHGTTPPVASTTTVKRALAALAAGHGFVPADSDPDTDGRSPGRVVADAETAVARLDTAAAFLAADGDRRLRQAIKRAERRDRRRLARRGQRVLATLDRFRAAAERTDRSARPATDRPEVRRPRSDAPSRETVKRTGGQPPDR
jgi:hypothetical protein